MLNRLSLAILLLFPVTALLAHHSLAAEFDTSKPIVLNGKVTKVEWMNPHVFIWIDVPDSTGTVTNWTLESVAPNYLRRLGWTKPALKVGDKVSVEAYRAKDQANLAKTEVVTLPDGRRIITGVTADQAAGSRK